MVKHHFVPRLIIKNFMDSKGNIFFYSKKNNDVSKPIPHYNQLQNENFYSKNSLSELKNIFNYISINPIFKNIDKSLEENLNVNLESTMNKILNRIINPLINDDKIILSNEEIWFIKEYISIQHLRTTKFKEIAKEANKNNLKLPINAKEIINNIENNCIINPQELVNQGFPHLNSKERRKKVKELKRLLKNADFLNKIRQSEKIDSFLNDEIKKIEENFEEIRDHPDKHSSEIIDICSRNNFFKICDMEHKKLRFILNKTTIPFVLTDTGIVIMELDYLIKKELRIYLPIHQKILIEVSTEVESISFADENFVKEFNQISKDESLINVYSNSINALNFN